MKTLNSVITRFTIGGIQHNGVDVPYGGIFQIVHPLQSSKGVQLSAAGIGPLLALNNSPDGIDARIRFPSIRFCGDFPQYRLLTAQAHLVSIIARLLPKESRLWIDCEAAKQHRVFALSNRFHFYTADEVEGVLKILTREEVLS
jgi:hypothetical protein